MGLFDSIMSASQAGSATGGQGDLFTSLMGMLNSPEIGGLAGLMQKFTQSGLSEQFASWVGNGQKLPVSAEQIQAVLGSSVVQSIAAKIGLDPVATAGALAGLLPQMVGQLTPDGKLPEGGVDAAQVFSAFSGLFGHK
ncbi:MAG: YidB family protein [Gallionella sp.]|nr:YidB family protein [Gallionella sp.]